jgi:mono/diheme cytochrome c family protein
MIYFAVAGAIISRRQCGRRWLAQAIRDRPDPRQERRPQPSAQSVNPAAQNASGGETLMKSLACILLLIAAASAPAAGTYTPDFDRGRVLYDAHCRHCHTPGIHSRPNKLPLTRDEVAAMVDHFRRTENLGWTREEVEDVVEYLNRTRYRFAPR